VKLPIPTMDAVLVEFSSNGSVRFEDEEWSVPNLQERRAIIHAARASVEELEELIAAIEALDAPR
jgi:hypothetical protein